MPNWEITVVVPGGKRFETALLLAHSLRPISMNVVPIGNGPPGRGATQVQRVQAALAADPKKVWGIKEMAQHLGTTRNAANMALLTAVQAKQARKVGPGKYQALKGSK